MVSKTLVQMVLFFISMVMIGAFFLETIGRWSSSNGPLTTARITNKNQIINQKSGNSTFSIDLKFKRQQGDSVTATTEVSQHIYEAYSIRSLVPIHYQLNNPKNAVVAVEGWFEWSSLGVLAFGLVLLYAGVTMKEGKQETAV